MAALAAHAQESVLKPPALQIRLELLLNELDWNNAADWAHPGKLGKYRW